MLESNQLHWFRRPGPNSLDQWDFSEIAGFEPADPFKGIDSLAMSSFKPGSRKFPLFGGRDRSRPDMGLIATCCFRGSRNCQFCHSSWWFRPDLHERQLACKASVLLLNYETWLIPEESDLDHQIQSLRHCHYARDQYENGRRWRS